MGAETSRATLSLKSRVALAVASVLLVGGAVVLIAALAYGRSAAREAYDRLLIGAAADIAASISVRDGAALVDMPMSAFELLALARDDRIDYRVVGPDGRTLTGDDAAPLPTADGDTVFYDGDFGAEPARYVSVIRRFAERSFSGSVRVVVGHTLRARQALARDIAQGALAVLGGAGAAMALFSWLVMRSALLPLPRIGAALTRRDPSDLTPLDLAAPQEIAGMLDALNGFMARLDRQVSMNRAMIEDAAHQLRTPVAAIRAQAQLAEDEPDPARRARILARVHDRAVGLSRLLDQMLSQAMIIHRADAAARAPIDLRDIALEVLEDGETDAGAAGAEVRLDLPPGPVMVRGDALSLTEAGKNLLGNAIRHGAAPVRIGVRGGPVPALWISDAGDGRPDDLRAQAEERFARGASAGGAGLGLAIARAVATGHDGALAFTREGGRLVASIELPGQGA